MVLCDKCGETNERGFVVCRDCFVISDEEVPALNNTILALKQLVEIKDKHIGMQDSVNKDLNSELGRLKDKLSISNFDKEPESRG